MASLGTKDYAVIAIIIAVIYYLFHSKGLAVTDACLVGAPHCGMGIPASAPVNMKTSPRPMQTPGDPCSCGVARSVVDSNTRISWCTDPDTGSIFSIDALSNPNIPVVFLTDPAKIAESEDLNGVPAGKREATQGVTGSPDTVFLGA